ncbi:MAG: ATP-dependent DNA helicase RecG [Gammaproteobacteria bacterium]|nr:ATP-dependent DNA helicase RecG [Gammaproteobacteria bacterium]
MDIELQPVSTLRGVGPKIAEKLGRLGLRTVQDVLFHLPFRYQDRTRLTPIGSLRAGQEAMFCGNIELADVVYRGRRNLLCRVADGSGSIMLRFFHFSGMQHHSLQRGALLRCFGEVRNGPAGLELVHPEYELLPAGALPHPESRLTPVYPVTEGVHQLSLRRLIAEVLDTRLQSIHEWLPDEVLAMLQLPTLREALDYVHRPPPQAAVHMLVQGIHPAQQRLAFEELLAYCLSLRKLRERVRRHDAPVIDADGRLLETLLARLPFKLTAAQSRVIAEIMEDLRQGQPMQRMVQGDVGSGKTLVAAAAALCAVESGWQVAIMAPTELLAEQHWRNLRDWFAPMNVEVAWLAGRHSAPMRRSTCELVASGRAPVVVGTHALFQRDIEFNRLGLVIVDEQHRFGVHQRLLLREKGAADGRCPHQLIMTATPIPRTLAQSVYADLDVSVIDELPAGRRPVETAVIPDSRRESVVQRVRSACLERRQVYWVCSLIDESDALQLQTATATEAALREALPELKIRLVHGRMKSAEKEQVMGEFKSGAIDLLVATTVIEVGVDVPNASLMIIENAERLGLSQLHQLRGRVGRGAVASSCVLMYRAPLSMAARERLAIMRATNDGFEIARKDLEMRGPGEVLGTRQAGEQQFHIADLVRDQSALPQIEKVATLLLDRYPQHVAPIVRRWLGVRDSYAGV